MFIHRPRILHRCLTSTAYQPSLNKFKTGIESVATVAGPVSGSKYNRTGWKVTATDAPRYQRLLISNSTKKLSMTAAEILDTPGAKRPFSDAAKAQSHTQAAAGVKKSESEEQNDKRGKAIPPQPQNSTTCETPRSGSVRGKEHKPKDWTIVVTAPGGQELSFYNTVDGTNTWYKPEGMTAAEIMQIPDAKKHASFRTEESTQLYIDAMAKEKKKHEEEARQREENEKAKRHSPFDWMIMSSHLQDRHHLCFYNKHDGAFTYYIPEGMTASEIMRIPDAKRYERFFATLESTQAYIDAMVKEEMEDGSKDKEEQ